MWTGKSVGRGLEKREIISYVLFGEEELSAFSRRIIFLLVDTRRILILLKTATFRILHHCPRQDSKMTVYDDKVLAEPDLLSRAASSLS